MTASPLTASLSRRSIAKMALIGAGSLGLVCASASTAAHPAASHLRSVTTAQRNADAQRLLDLINTYRRQNGRAALRHSAKAAVVMDEEARRQVIAGYFSHGTKFIYDSRVQGYSFVREVIALSYNDDISQLIAFWKSSPAHNAAILAPEANVCAIGLAHCTGSNGLPWRVIGNVGIYRYANGAGPNDYSDRIDTVGTQGGGAEVIEEPQYPIVNGIASRYYADGGRNVYGDPTTAERGGLIENGVYQEFDKNGVQKTIIWHPWNGAYAVHEPGAIGRYWRANGSERGFGFPTANERSLGGGGYEQTFRNGNRRYKVLFHYSFGANSVYENGAIGITWNRAGGVNGYGYPLTGEYWSGAEVHQRFSSGTTLAWHSATGAVRAFRG